MQRKKTGKFFGQKNQTKIEQKRVKIEQQKNRNNMPEKKGAFFKLFYHSRDRREKMEM